MDFSTEPSKTASFMEPIVSLDLQILVQTVSPPTIAATNPGRIPNPGANAIRTTHAPITILRRPTPLP
ncbi:hypothetical protein ONZ45_g17256 [Pleurotus djamor]|nr:hypothetical protein ONZ45_g17256 [Pleurotus djamor]